MKLYQSKRAILMVLAGVLTLGLGGCGDDDDDTAQATSTTSADPVEQASASVDVEMVEYGYKVSGAVMAGGTVKLRNTGKEFHMMGMGKLKDGKTLDDFRRALLEGGPEGEEAEVQEGASTTEGSTPATAADEGGEEEDPTADIIDEVGPPAGIMGPGQQAEITVPDLAAGSYVLVCFIPTEGPGGAPHFTKGMLGELKVVEDKAPEPTADATYKISKGKPIEGLATLAPGRHVIKIEAADDAGDNEPTLVRPDPGKTYKDMDKAFETFEEAVPVNAAAAVPGKLVVGLFDFKSVRTVYLTVDLEAGTYHLSGEDSDLDVPEFKEIITIKVA